MEKHTGELGDWLYQQAIRQVVVRQEVRGSSVHTQTLLVLPNNNNYLETSLDSVTTGAHLDIDPDIHSISDAEAQALLAGIPQS
jgi:hypothetical protein